MDIKFEKEGFKFNVRGSCIIKDMQGNIILTNMRGIKDHEAFLLPGGRLEVLENSKEAIQRELKEELGIDVDCKLVSIEENISKENAFHMLEFVYYAQIKELNVIGCLDNGWDKFKIVKCSDIDKYDIRPKSIKKVIAKSEYIDIEHHINYDWARKNI